MMAQPLPQTQTFTGEGAPFPSEPVAAEVNRPTIHDFLESCFNDYVKFLSETPKTYVYELPAKFPEDISVRQEFSRDMIVDQKREELMKYVQVAFVKGDIMIDPSIFPQGQPLTVDTLADAVVTDGITRAQERYDEAHLNLADVELPDRITRSETEADDEGKTAFFDRVTQFGARALQAITLHSGQVTIPRGQYQQQE